MAIELVFHKNSAFGNNNSEGRTWRQSTPGKILFDANTGKFLIEPQSFIEPLDVAIEHANMSFPLKANELKVCSYSNSIEALCELINSLCYVFPPVLSLTFDDIICIERVSGSVGSENFRWELKAAQLNLVVSNQEKLEESVAKAWNYMTVLSD